MTAVANDNVCPTRPNLFARLVGKFVTHRRNVRAMRAMLEMNDHMLRDIGVTRFDIRHAIKGGSSESCGARLARVVEEKRIAQLRRQRSENTIRPHTADEQARMAA